MKTTLHKFTRAALACAIAAATAQAQAGVFPQGPKDGSVCDATGSQGKVCRHLAAGDGWLTYADGTRTYTFGFSEMTGVPNDQVITKATFNAKFPAPNLSFKEGQEVYLSLTNVGMTHRPDLFDPHSIHFHGFPQSAPIYDGTPEGSVTVNMGSTLTYYYKLNDPGTYMYHCHVESAEHMEMGMLGNLYVKPRQDGTPITVTSTGKTYTSFAYNDGDGSTGYDVEAALQLGAFDQNFHALHEAVQPLPFESLSPTHTFINGRNYPDTVDTRTSGFVKTLVDPDDPASALPETSQPLSSLVTARKGDRILLRLSNLAIVNYYTVTAMGLPFRVVGAGAAMKRGFLVDPLTNKVVDHSFRTQSVTLGGGESVDVIVDTEDVQPGTYVLYTTNLNFLSNGSEDRGGMMTHIVINP